MDAHFRFPLPQIKQHCWDMEQFILKPVDLEFEDSSSGRTRLHLMVTGHDLVEAIAEHIVALFGWNFIEWLDLLAFTQGHLPLISN